MTSNADNKGGLERLSDPVEQPQETLSNRFEKQHDGLHSEQGVRHLLK